MYYKIEKSLGRPVAIEVDSIPEKGICVDVKNFRSKDISIIIYQDGKLKDLQINNWTFPYVYNEIWADTRWHNSNYDDDPRHCDFPYIDPTGYKGHSFEEVVIGYTEAQAAENLIYELFMLSYCENFDQYKELRYLSFYKHGIRDEDRVRAQKIVDYVDSIKPHLSNLKDTEYLEEVLNKINREYDKAKEYLSSTDK